MKGRPRNRTPRNPSGKSFGNQGFVETGLGHWGPLQALFEMRRLLN
jgi:hypothetical protein